MNKQQQNRLKYIYTRHLYDFKETRLETFDQEERHFTFDNSSKNHSSTLKVARRSLVNFIKKERKRDEDSIIQSIREDDLFRDHIDQEI